MSKLELGRIILLVRKIICGNKIFMRIKEKRQYAILLRSFPSDNDDAYHLTTDYLYRNSYLNDRNRQLVDLCKMNDTDGIRIWYEKNDNDTFYSDEYFANRMSMRLIARHIIETHNKNVSILDVACGHGEIDKVLYNSGFTRIKAIDLNTNRINELKNCICAEEGDIDSIDFSEEFDVVIALEILEHVPNIITTLRKIYSIMRPHGYLYISTPNKYMIDDESHVRIFDKSSLVFLLRESGFTVCSVASLAYLNHEKNNDLVCICKKG